MVRAVRLRGKRSPLGRDSRDAVPLCKLTERVPLQCFLRHAATGRHRTSSSPRVEDERRDLVAVITDASHAFVVGHGRRIRQSITMPHVQSILLARDPDIWISWWLLTVNNISVPSWSGTVPGLAKDPYRSIVYIYCSPFCSDLQEQSLPFFDAPAQCMKPDGSALSNAGSATFSPSLQSLSLRREHIFEIRAGVYLMHYALEVDISGVRQFLKPTDVLLQPRYILAGWRNREASLPACLDVP